MEKHGIKESLLFYSKSYFFTMDGKQREYIESRNKLFHRIVAAIEEPADSYTTPTKSKDFTASS